MNKKHFISLASHLRGRRDLYSDPALEYLAEWLQTQNPAFKRQRWLDFIAGRCGPNGGRKTKRNQTNVVIDYPKG